MHQSLRDRVPALATAPEVSAGLLRRVAVGAGSGWRMVYGGDNEDDPASGCGTTGIAVSECGRTVSVYHPPFGFCECNKESLANTPCRYVGIKEGIFEFKMNFDERKTWAAFEPR